VKESGGGYEYKKEGVEEGSTRVKECFGGGTKYRSELVKEGINTGVKERRRE
jgi:hypothetical protein